MMLPERLLSNVVYSTTSEHVRPNSERIGPRAGHGRHPQSHDMIVLTAHRHSAPVPLRAHARDAASGFSATARQPSHCAAVVGGASSCFWGGGGTWGGGGRVTGCGGLARCPAVSESSTFFTVFVAAPVRELPLLCFLLRRFPWGEFRKHAENPEFPKQG